MLPRPPPQRKFYSGTEIVRSNATAAHPTIAQHESTTICSHLEASVWYICASSLSMLGCWRDWDKYSARCAQVPGSSLPKSISEWEAADKHGKLHSYRRTVVH